MRYEKVGDKKECQSAYTYTGNTKCDGWNGITLEECKVKCTNNEVPNDACPRQDVKCIYISYNYVTSWCHLGDEACVPMKSQPEGIVFKKRG